MERLTWLFSPDVQVKLAVVIFVGALIGWPLSALTIFSGEPQGILGLSWFAIIWTAHNTIITAVANRKVHEDDG